MTWAKLSDNFGDEMAGLSDAAFRTHVEALLWTMRRETDGQLSERDVRRFAETSDPHTAVQELLDHGLWRREPGGYVVLHHMEHQPESDVIAARRRKAAERQAKARRKAAGLSEEPIESESPRESPRESRRDSPRDETRDPVRSGTDRTGTGSSEDEQERESQDEPAGEPDPWSQSAAVPRRCASCRGLIGRIRECAGHELCGSCDLASLPPIAQVGSW